MAVLDASAVIALLVREPGAEVVQKAMSRAEISSVNLAEVITKLIDRGFTESDISLVMERLRLHVHPFDEAAAYRSARLRAATRARGLSLGDRACLALGVALSQPVLTADQSWAKLDVGVDVRVIR
ncbi:MAG: type II toxin-antitoxin system VapC family toxin [Rhodospirillaceae bacterium]|nr:type II toxin-antitoxin system VapC family toxin [Rhodospirillaceae bacterium]